MKFYYKVNGGFEEFVLNVLLYICFLTIAFMLALGVFAIVHQIRYKCVRGHHEWVMHHTKGGHHLRNDFICDEEVLRSDKSKHCNCDDER